MQKSIALGSGIAILLLTPLCALAAFDNVTLTTGSARLSVNGVTLDVAVSNALLSQIVVNASSMTLTLNAGSKMSVTSADRRTLTISDSGGTAQTGNTCTSAISEADVSSTVTDTVTITVGDSTCTASTAAPGGGSTGGGGGPLLVPSTSPTAQVVLTTTAQIAQTQTQPSAGKFSSLTKAMKRGITGAQAKTLQKMLNQDPATQVSVSGAGSPGHETTLFGAATEAAVKKFQKLHGIVSSGTPSTTGYGAVGPKTRSALNNLYGGL